MGGRISVLAWFGVALILMLFPACQKPMLRSDKSDKSDKSENSGKEGEEIVSKTPGESPGGDTENEDPFGDKELKAMKNPTPPAAVVPKLTSQERAREISRRKQMLEAQLAGIQGLEADVARHSGPLNQLRQQLQSVRARQSGQRSGGVRVERIGGKSLFVDRKKEARELESRIKVQEQLVAPLLQSLEVARKDYVKLRQSIERLRAE